MKRKFFLVLMCLLCLASVTGGTLAYFTDTGTAHNVITTGAVKIAVEEWQMVEGKREPYPQTPMAVMPGATVSKEVCIRNQKADSYIRAAVEIVLTDDLGKTVVLTQEEANKILQINMNSVSWQREPEESRWWYYRQPVQQGEATEPLFTEVVFSGRGMDNAYQNSTLEVRVFAQAVQTAHNGVSAMTANGWPEA